MSWVKDTVMDRCSGRRRTTQNLDRDDQRVGEEIRKHFRVEDVNGAVIRRGGKEWVAFMETDGTCRLFVEVQSFERGGCEVKIPP